MDPQQNSFLIIASLGLSSLFSLLESSIFALQESLLHLNNDSIGYAKTSKLKKIFKRKTDIINMLLLLNNLCNIFASSVATVFFINVFSKFDIDTSTIISVSSVFVSVIIFVVCDSLPKTIGANNAYSVCVKFASLILTLWQIFKPFVLVVSVLNEKIINKLKLKHNFEISSEEEIISTAEMLHRQGRFDKEEKNMISGLLSMKDVEISEIMTHRNDMYAVDISDSDEKILKILLEAKHSRVPVYNDKPDDIIGVIKVKDFLKTKYGSAGVKNCIKEIMQEPMFSPDTVDIKKQLSMFKKTRQHLAFVIDEHGGLMGLVTLEDIIEEIVGEIDDENDQVTQDIVKISDNEYNVSGECSVKDFNDFVGTELNFEEIDTVAGLVIEQIERIPVVDEVINIDNVQFKIKEIKKNRITKMVVKIFDKDQEEE